MRGHDRGGVRRVAGASVVTAELNPRSLVSGLVEAAHAAILARVDELTDLDRAIGDGDHGVNMRRGLDAVAGERSEICALPFGEAMRRIGTTLVLQVGGASGPLYGSFLLAVADRFQTAPQTVSDVARLVSVGLAAMKARGRADIGAKTMLDVLAPVEAALARANDAASAAAAARGAAQSGLEATRNMRALTGRASYLGERSVGFFDPGARSAAALVEAVCDFIEGKPPSSAREGVVSIVIVSQSAKVAHGAADMVRQMVGDAVPVAVCGGNVAGELGTDAAAIMRAIEAVYSVRGVAVLVDLGGAETNAEMAIEMLPATMAPHIRICDAPVVEGAVMAATEAAGGAPLDRVCATAEEFRS